MKNENKIYEMVTILNEIRSDDAPSHKLQLEGKFIMKRLCMQNATKYC